MEQWTPEVLEVLSGLVTRAIRRAHRRFPWSRDHDAIESAAWFGAVQAFTTFDPSRGFKLSTYARHRIHGRILDDLEPLIKRHNRGVELPWAAAKEQTGRMAPVVPAIEARRDLITLLDRANLEPRELRLIQAYHFEELPMREIAVELGVAESRVSQLNRGILEKLRSTAQNLTPRPQRIRIRAKRHDD